VTVTFMDGMTTETIQTTGGGHYAHRVAAGWKGIVKPGLSGYYFLPGSAALGPIRSNVVQDFILSPLHAGPFYFKKNLRRTALPKEAEILIGKS
jgi:hypothetical protein